MVPNYWCNFILAKYRNSLTLLKKVALRYSYLHTEVQVHVIGELSQSNYQQ